MQYVTEEEIEADQIRRVQKIIEESPEAVRKQMYKRILRQTMGVCGECQSSDWRMTETGYCVCCNCGHVEKVK